MHLLTTRIDLAAIAHNTRQIKAFLGDAVRLMCVVKADAYGHGAARCAAVMADNGADGFGVATVAEALALREAGVAKPILAWIWDPAMDLSDPLAANIDLAVTSPAHADALVAAQIPARVAVKVETGMHRSGVSPADFERVFRLLGDAPHLTVTGLMSHLACADAPADSATDEQARAFRSAIDAAHAAGLDVPVNHLCNTAGALTRPDLHFQQVRVGLGLYGGDAFGGVAGASFGAPEIDLRPAMAWQAIVTAVRPIHAGESSGYGLTWRAERDGYLALIPAGYADGIPRSAQGALDVTIGGVAYPLVGRVSMDQVVVDLGANEHGVTPGDAAVLFGPGGYSAQEVASALGTIDYEVMLLPKGRTRREYVDSTESA